MAENQKVYFAAPLFSINERSGNRRLAHAIEQIVPGIKIILPQDIKFHGKFNDELFFKRVYDSCIAGVNSCAAVIAILDGASADDGTSFEVGYAVAKGIPVVGIRTDYRQSQELGMNLMLSRGCTEISFRPAFNENLDLLAKDVAKKLRRVLDSRWKARNNSF